MRSWWSEPQSAPGLVFADCIQFLHLQLQRMKSIWFWYWPFGDVLVKVIPCVVEKEYLLWPVHSLCSSLTRDQTCAHSTESLESSPLDHQGSPQQCQFFKPRSHTSKNLSFKGVCSKAKHASEFIAVFFEIIKSKGKLTIYWGMSK